MAGAPHLEAFLDSAYHYLGITPGDALYDEMCSYAGYAGYSGAWCAVFVLGCAGRAGILGTVITGDSWAADVLLMTADQCGGEFFEGPGCNGGVAVTPAPGDLVTFSWDDDHFGTEHASHVGIVKGVSNGYVHTYEGNTSGTCAERSYSLDYGCINMYVRPDWSRVGDDASEYTSGSDGGSGGSGGSGSSSSGGGYVPLYTSRNDRHDMTLREVCYLNSSYQLANRQSSVAISIMNYTSLLADLYDYLGVGNRGGGGTTVNVDTSGLTEFSENVKNAVDYFLERKYSASAACGLAATLMTYSGIAPWFIKKLANGTNLEGIAAWEHDDYQKVKTAIGADASSNLSGQLMYCVDELEADYKSLVSATKNAQLGSVKAQDVAKKFIWNYNTHYRHSDYEKEAMDYAKDFYDALKFTQTSNVANGKDLRDIDGRQLTPQFTVDIPSDIWQSGIDGNYTSYSYFYHRWNSSSKQRQIADQWAYEGYPYDRGSIALVGGYYCVAVSTTFGYVGDIIVVTLANGDSFAAIIADSKNPNDSNCGEYGHYYDNGALNVIEWERICTYNGEVQTEGSSYNIVDGIELGSWAGQDVTSITNYGSYGI
jgi:hypothetical protein